MIDKSPNVFDLSKKRQEHEWQRILPLLEFLETTLNSIPPTAEELAEEEAIDVQLKALDCKARAKVLLLRTLENPEAGTLNATDIRIKKALENDPAVIYQKDPEFWSKHISQFRGFNNKQRKDFYKRMTVLLGWQSMDGDEGYTHIFLRCPNKMTMSVCRSVCVPESALTPSEQDDVRCPVCSGIRE